MLLISLCFSSGSANRNRNLASSDVGIYKFESKNNYSPILAQDGIGQRLTTGQVFRIKEYIRKSLESKDARFTLWFCAREGQAPFYSPGRLARFVIWRFLRNAHSRLDEQPEMAAKLSRSRSSSSADVSRKRRHATITALRKLAMA
jgi:hypothetical protein